MVVVVVAVLLASQLARIGSKGQLERVEGEATNSWLPPPLELPFAASDAASAANAARALNSRPILHKLVRTVNMICMRVRVVA